VPNPMLTWNPSEGGKIIKVGILPRRLRNYNNFF
jgi:hypothetical protein